MVVLLNKWRSSWLAPSNNLTWRIGSMRVDRFVFSSVLDCFSLYGCNEDYWRESIFIGEEAAEFIFFVYETNRHDIAACVCGSSIVYNNVSMCERVVCLCCWSSSSVWEVANQFSLIVAWIWSEKKDVSLLWCTAVSFLSLWERVENIVRRARELCCAVFHILHGLCS